MASLATAGPGSGPHAHPHYRTATPCLGEDNNELDLGARTKVYGLAVAEQTITEVAGEVGTSSDTLRYYEKIGLITPSGRTSAGYRLYGDDVADRLRLIKGAQRSGLRLREVRQLLEIKDRGGCPCGHTQALLAQRIAEIDNDLDRIRSLRSELVHLLRFAQTCSDPDFWACEAELVRRGGDRR